MAMPDGLAVGDTAPDFTLPTGGDDPFSLGDALADSSAAVVVFYHFAFEDG